MIDVDKSTNGNLQNYLKKTWKHQHIPNTAEELMVLFTRSKGNAGICQLLWQNNTIRHSMIILDTMVLQA
jgi:hypothetical protein